MAAQSETSTTASASRTESLALLAAVILLLGTAWPAMKIGLAGATPIAFAAAAPPSRSRCSPASASCGFRRAPTCRSSPRSVSSR
jgi:hypothetical protein